jgi:integrase/recombinase XerD
MLVDQGYLPGPISCHMKLLVAASCFMQREALSTIELTAARIDQFLAERRAAGHTDRLTPKAMLPILSYLTSIGAGPPTPIGPNRDRLEQLREDYRTYLTNERGLVEWSVDCYSRYADIFLTEIARGTGAVVLSELDAIDVISFVQRQAGSRNVHAAKQLVNATRWFLRYLATRQLVRQDFSGVVPSVAGWQVTSIPRAVTPEQLAAALSLCDRRKATGVRDYAVIYLIARLGLRAAEVAAITLDDLDWHAGTLFVRGKGHRDEVMPIPPDVGAVIAEYLADDRQRRSGRHLFMRVHAPVGPLNGAGISQIVHSAFARAGIERIGSHSLRHTAAVEMLRSGASLSEIGQVLRHRSSSSTAIYAKVDYAALSTFIRPWPGARS